MENSYEDTQEMFESGNDEDENKSPFKQMLSYSQTILEKLEKQNQMLEHLEKLFDSVEIIQKEQKKHSVLLNEMKSQGLTLPDIPQSGKRKRFWRKKKQGKSREEEQFFAELSSENFTESQLEEIQLGLDAGLTIKEVCVYGKKEISGENMRRIREIYLKMKGNMDNE